MYKRLNLIPSLTFLLYLLSSIGSGFAQKHTLWIDGKVKEDKKRLAGASIALFKEGDPVETQITKNNGTWDFKIPLEANYLVVFSKPGYVTKMLKIIAKDIPFEDAEFGFEQHNIHVSLFRPYKGVDYSVYDEPIAHVIYDTEQQKFIFDADYFEFIKPSIDSLNEEISEEPHGDLLAQAEADAQIEMERKLLEQEKIEAEKERKREEKKRALELELEQEKKRIEEDQRNAEAEKIRQQEELKAQLEEEKRKKEEAIKAKMEEDLRKEQEKEKQRKIEEDLKTKQEAERIQKQKELEQEKALEERKKAARLARLEREKEQKAKANSELSSGADNETKPNKLDASNFEQGMTEEVFKKGNKIITKRIIVQGDVADEYRRVVTTWGGKYFFKNDISITERMWVQETDKWVTK